MTEQSIPMSNKLELHFKCGDLKRMDYLSKSDPYIEVYEKTRSGELVLLGKTEVIENNENPDFQTSITVQYHFEEQQFILVRVLDKDEVKNGVVTAADRIGECVFALSSLASARGMTLTQKLCRDAKKGGGEFRGRVTIAAEEVDERASHSYVTVQNLSLGNLRGIQPQGLCGCLAPRVETVSLWFYKTAENGQDQVFYKTERVRFDDALIRFKNFEMSAQKMCNGDFHRPLRVILKDVISDDNQTTIAQFQTSLQSLLNADGGAMTLMKIKNGVPTGQSVGQFSASVSERSRPCFLDYIRGGLQMNLHVAVDFTASNGMMMDPRSLHYLSQGMPNKYEQVLQSVGMILRDYDADKKIPLYGFGAGFNMPHSGQKHGVSHVFGLNQANPMAPNPNDPEVNDVGGLMQCYRAALPNVTLAGPTLFGPLLNELVRSVQASVAQTGSAGSGYHTLLLLTDGAIHDMQDTINTIVQGSSLPLSIVIVGIGNADFSSMEHLDADGNKLRASNGTLQERDNVQFVPFNSCGNSASRLAAQVLQELPEQVVQYYDSRGIKPAPPMVAVAQPVSYEQCQSGFDPAVMNKNPDQAFIVVPSAPDVAGA